MFRRIVITLTMLLALPAFANATWYVTASKSGGDATCKVSPASSTMPGFTGYTTVRTQAGAGFQVNKVTVDNAIQCVNPLPVPNPAGYALCPSSGSYQVNYAAGKTYRIVNAYFGTAMVAGASITVNKPANSTYRVTTPVNGSLTNITLGSNRTIAIIPVSGYTVTVAAANISPAGACTTAASGQFFGAVDVTCNNIQGPITIGGTSGISQTVTANAGPDRTVSAPNSAITLNGSGTYTVGPATYAWTVTAKPAGSTVTFGTAAAAATTFSADAAGTYDVQLQVSAAGGFSATDTATIVVASATATAEQACALCHTARNLAVMNGYDAASDIHKTKNVTCQACHDPSGTGHYTAAAPDCGTCHTAKAEFEESKHWKTVGNVGLHYTGSDETVPNAEAPAPACAYRCHFKATTYVPNSVPGDMTVGTGYGCSTCHGGALTTGGNSTLPVNDHTIKVATVDNTCYYCHSGSKHGWSVRAFEKSSHFTGAHAIQYYQGNTKKCLICHTPHNPEASMTNGLTDTCAGCHQSGPYGIYGVGGIPQAPHTLGTAAPASGAVNVGDSTTKYLTQGAICADCHGHNNSINAGFAEGGHGKVSSEPLNPWTHYDWSTKTNNGTRQNGNCDRCHTAYGFIKFANQTTGLTRLRLQAGQPNNVLICIGCHKAIEGEFSITLPQAPLRIDATPAGNPTALTGGYFALFSSSASSITAGNTKIQIQFPGYKNSSICVPCHAGRSTDKVFVETIAKSLAVNGNYSTIGTSYYQHAKNVGQTFIGKGAYDFTGKLATIGVSVHGGVKMAAADTQGPCVGCHYSVTTKTHSLEIDPASATCVTCHSTTITQASIDAAKANFDAGVKALDILIRSKMTNMTATGVTQDLSTERGYVRFGQLFRQGGETPAQIAALATKGYGAWYNWQILETYDNAAWAHNPAYARQILMDTVDYLDNGLLDNSAAATIAATAGLTATEVTDAKQFIGTTSGGNSNGGCVGCHAIGQNVAGFVNDNNGVRAITTEFNKRSHHITGTTLTNAQCAVCHLEGNAGGGVNPAYHMKDAKIHLRNCNTSIEGSAEYVWDPATPNHTAMDNFCFSCHNATGATAAVGIVPGNSASNPFADTLTNGYDQVARAGVVDVKSAFNTANASHHAVSGKRYAYRFSTRANADAWTAAKAGRPVVADSEIAVGNLDLSGNTIPASAFDSTGMEATKALNDMTLFEADKFVEAYTPLGASQSVGDNSTLHCGDCHTVGQWKAGSTTDADGNAAVAIGTHGSANEYLLRNSLGTDALHTGQTYVCFLCHGTEGKAMVYETANDTLWNELVSEGEIAASVVKPTWKAGWGGVHPNVLAGQVRGYATAHSVVGFHAQCQVDSSFATGATARLALNPGGGHKDRLLDFTPAAGATAAFPAANGDSGNVTGIACTNCHNSGLRSSWGGIHGGNNTYTDGLGRAQTTYRFMPGMGNYKYAPPGGWDGKDTSDTTLLTTSLAGPGANKPMGGCYTNGASSDTNPGFSTCSHHGTSTTTSGGRGPGSAHPEMRASYGGGTASSPTAAEPTVRESSAGNVLVTRPLKY
jgi:hypothetical protein